MLRFLLVRAIGIVPQLLAVSMLAFVIMMAAPGDPVASLAGGTEFMTEADHQRVLKNLGLDRPLHVQYGDWLLRMAQGDWGHSLKDGREVSGMLLYALGHTLTLVGCVWILMVASALVLGYWAGSRPHSATDYAVSGFSTLSFAIPPFWLGLMLILIFSVMLDIFPSSGVARIGVRESFGDRFMHLVLPVTTIYLSHIGPYIRLVRGSVRDTLSSGFVRAARARGLGRWTVVSRYLLPNALGPFITWAGFSFPLLVGGIFVVEWVFGWPGLGRLFLLSALQRNYPVLMGAVVVICVMVIVGNLLADCLAAALNPKLRRVHGS